MINTLKKMSGYIEGATILLFVIVVTSLFARQHYLAEMLCHFRLQYLICSALALTFFSLIKQKRYIKVSSILLSLNIILLISAFDFQQQQDNGKSSKELSLIHYNVLSTNKNYQEIINYFKTQSPDILVVLEVSHEWAKHLKVLEADYTVSKIFPSEDNFGIALFVKEPGTIEKLYLDPSLVASLHFQNEHYQLLATHPIPPSHSASLAMRNSHFEAISQMANQAKKDFILVGDLNCTPYSPYFQDLCQQSKFQRTSILNGLKATWPSHLPFLGIPIDHVLTSQNIELSSYSTGPNLKSDHWPLEIKLKFH